MHQNSEQAAFFFAYLLSNEIKDKGVILPASSGSSTSSGGGILPSYDKEPSRPDKQKVPDKDVEEGVVEVVEQASDVTPTVSLMLKIFRSDLSNAIKTRLLGILLFKI